METRKLTEGALLSALQIVLGLILLPTGIGYSLYVELLLPVMMTVIYARCGRKIGFLAGMNTVILSIFCFGNVVSAIYIGQALGFGFLCGGLIQRKGGFRDDLMIASLIGCVFLLILDALTAQFVGYSLLDTAGLDEIFYRFLPDGTEEMFQIIFYISIASVPIASVMMAYVGGLMLGHHMRLLRGEALEKYRMIHDFKVLAPYHYHSKKVIYYAIGGILCCYFLWPFAKGGYLKTILATSGLVLLYFVLTDFIKLIAQYLIDLGKTPMVASFFYFGMLIALMNAFYITCGMIMIVGCLIDVKASTRERQEQILKCYLKETIKVRKVGELKYGNRT